MEKMRKILTAMLIVTISIPVVAKHHSQLVTYSGNVMQLTRWHNVETSRDQPTILLLSGPTDNWNSDSAWFARLAPKLARNYQVFSADRAGQVSGNPAAKVGYAQFGNDIVALMQSLKPKKLHIIAFASANIALNHYFANPQHTKVKSVIMIDPDVLNPYSMGRYKKDAAPFKENLAKYITYIGEGKYDNRALQKNEIEMAHLKALSKEDPDTDWVYVESLFASRLKPVNLQNLFREIASYGEDLDSAAKLGFPNTVALTIVDTDFEQTYIDNSKKAEEKAGLSKWRDDARSYYQQLVQNSVSGEYIALETKEHLLPFSDPTLLIRLIDASIRR